MSLQPIVLLMATKMAGEEISLPQSQSGPSLPRLQLQSDGCQCPADGNFSELVDSSNEYADHISFKKSFDDSFLNKVLEVFPNMEIFNISPLDLW